MKKKACIGHETSKFLPHLGDDPGWRRGGLLRAAIGREEAPDWRANHKQEGQHGAAGKRHELPVTKEFEQHAAAQQGPNGRAQCKDGRQHAIHARGGPPLENLAVKKKKKGKKMKDQTESWWRGGGKMDLMSALQAVMTKMDA